MSYIIHAAQVNSLGKTIYHKGTQPLSLECANAWLEYLERKYPTMKHWKEEVN